MTLQIRIGDQGKTLGPLKPTGRISINGQNVDASSNGEWIDSNSDVVVIGGSSRQVLVSVMSRERGSMENGGDVLPDGKEIETTPLHAPHALVERINIVGIGFVVGIVLIPAAWLSGTTLSFYALLVPFSAALAGWLSRGFVGVARELAGPREDHRPHANSIDLTILVCCIVACTIAISIGSGFLGLNVGLLAGVLAAGAARWLLAFI